MQGKKPNFVHLQFNVDVSELARFEKAYIGVMETLRMIYNSFSY